ncbi:MAG: nuclear transport factor 2 family protein [Vicinamibacteria bacterium]
MTTKEIADRLVALCRANKNIEAIDTLFSHDVVSVEARGDETMPAEMRGIDAIRGKNEWWVANHKTHSVQVKGPYPNGDRFGVIFVMDVSPLVGPMIGVRMKMEEIALYTVTGGKISREEFFYDMSGGEAAAAQASKKKSAKKKTAVKKASETTPTSMAMAKTKMVKARVMPVKGKTKTKAKAKARR